MPDGEIKKHSEIGAVEFLLKHIRRKDFSQHYRHAIQLLQETDERSRRIMIQYLIERADVPEAELLKTVLEYLPQDEELIMTVAEQIGKRYFHDGMQQGIQQGAQQGVVEVAKKLKPSTRGELEITELHNWYLKKGELKVDLVRGEWIDMGTLDSLLKASNWAKKQVEK